MARPRYSSPPTPRVVSSGSVSKPRPLPKPRLKAAHPPTRRVSSPQTIVV